MKKGDGVKLEWTQQRILSKIRQLAERHQPLRCDHLRSRYPAAYKRLLSTFGSWPKAVEAARLDPNKYLVRREWTEEQIGEALRELAAEKGVLTTSDIDKRGCGLIDVLRKRYGTVEKAAEHFGSPFKRCQNQWSKERILEGLRQRHARGESLNSVRTQIEDQSLYHGARRWLGSWKLALEAAGFEHQDFHSKMVWDEEEIAKTLTHWVEQHGPLCASVLQKTGDSKLHDAATRIFGSLERAARIHNLPFKRIQEEWSYARISKEIRLLNKKRRSLTLKQVQQTHPKLIAAVHHRGLSWEEAVESAGLNFDRFRANTNWNPERIEYELKAWAAKHGEIVNRDLRKSNSRLLHACELRFGSLRKAAAHYWLPYRELIQSWNKEEVVHKIMERHRAGKTLKHNQVAKEDHKLCVAARRRFGSWEAALRHAGIDFEKFRTRQSWTPEKVEEALRRWVSENGPLEYFALHRTNSSLVATMERIYGSLSKAAQRLGLPFQRRVRQRPEKEVMMALEASLQANPGLTASALMKTDRKLYYTIKKRFGGLAKALAKLDAIRNG